MTYPSRAKVFSAAVLAIAYGTVLISSPATADLTLPLTAAGERTITTTIDTATGNVLIETKDTTTHFIETTTRTSTKNMKSAGFGSQRYTTRVEQDTPVELLETVTVEDEFYEDQWGLPKVQTAAAWQQQYYGDGVTVAIVDTGVDGQHPDLSAVTLPGADFSQRKPVIGGGKVDGNGHGTHVAGIVAASLNGQGGVGVAPHAQILPVKVLDDTGAGYASDVAEGIIWAADNGADIINVSAGSPNVSEAQKSAVAYAVSRGVVVVAAAGNEHVGGTEKEDSPLYPAGYPHVVGVAATTPLNEVASFSSRSSNVDVAAPGTMILSTSPGGKYAYMSGTSMATPFVSGMLALAKQPPASQLTGETAEILARKSTIDLETPGFNVGSGWGLLTADKLLLTVQGLDSTNPTVTVPVTPTPTKPTFKLPTKHLTVKTSKTKSIKVNRDFPSGTSYQWLETCSTCATSIEIVSTKSHLPLRFKKQVGSRSVETVKFVGKTPYKTLKKTFKLHLRGVVLKPF